MKKLKKISLQNLVQDEMAKREQNMLKGGVCACSTGCPCAYAGSQTGPNDSYYEDHPLMTMQMQIFH